MTTGGFAAEYRSEHELVDAIQRARGHGFTAIEAFTPYPIEEVDHALGAKRSPLAVAAGVGGLLGATTAYALQWFLVAYLYPIDAGMRPPHMPLPFVIITVEMGFLLGALSVSAAFAVAAGLLRLWDPMFEVPGFESATRAGFWLAIDARDPLWNRVPVADLLRDTGAASIYGFGVGT